MTQPIAKPYALLHTPRREGARALCAYIALCEMPPEKRLSLTMDDLHDQMGAANAKQDRYRTYQALRALQDCGWITVSIAMDQRGGRKVYTVYLRRSPTGK